jgi:hypothetical protein
VSRLHVHAHLRSQLAGADTLSNNTAGADQDGSLSQQTNTNSLISDLQSKLGEFEQFAEKETKEELKED